MDGFLQQTLKTSKTGKVTKLNWQTENRVGNEGEQTLTMQH